MNISPVLEKAIMKGLSVLKDDRYQNIDELLKGMKGDNDDTSVNKKTDNEQLRRVQEDQKGTVFIPKASGDGGDTKSSTVGRQKATGNKSKKQMVFILSGVALLLIAAIAVVIIIAANRKDPGGEKTNKNEVLESDLFDYKFELDNVVYQLPMPLKEMLDNGWSIRKENEDVEGADYYSTTNETILWSGVQYGVNLLKNGKAIAVAVINYSNEEKSISDCTVSGIIVKKASGFDFKIAKGISLDFTPETVQAAFGDPGSVDDGEYIEVTTITYFDSDSSQRTLT